MYYLFARGCDILPDLVDHFEWFVTVNERIKIIDKKEVFESVNNIAEKLYARIFVIF